MHAVRFREGNIRCNQMARVPGEFVVGHNRPVSGSLKNLLRSAPPTKRQPESGEIKRNATRAETSDLIKRLEGKTAAERAEIKAAFEASLLRPRQPGFAAPPPSPAASATPAPSSPALTPRERSPVASATRTPSRAAPTTPARSSSPSAASGTTTRPRPHPCSAVRMGIPPMGKVAAYARATQRASRGPAAKRPATSSPNLPSQSGAKRQRKKKTVVSQAP